MAIKGSERFKSVGVNIKICKSESRDYLLPIDIVYDGRKLHYIGVVPTNMLDVSMIPEKNQLSEMKQGVYTDSEANLFHTVMAMNTTNDIYLISIKSIPDS